MGWDAIDFNLIVPGMITNGPAQASFAGYLNTFSKALDERLNMLIETPDGSYPELPNISFEVGEIRSGNSFNDDFWEKLQDLINGYYHLWTRGGWYTADIMTDPINYTDYLLEDADLIAVIGQETYDIMDNILLSERLEYFTANVINAMYEIYKLTLYIRPSVNVLQFVGNEAVWGASSIDWFENVFFASGGNFNEPEPGFSAANGIARLRFSSEFNDPEFTNRSNDIISIDMQIRAEHQTGEEPEWEVAYIQDACGITMYTRFRDLDDNLLDMEVAPTMFVLKNYKQRQVDSDPPEFVGPHSSAFNQVNPLDPAIEYNAIALLTATLHQQEFGTTSGWAPNGGTINNPTLPKSASTGGVDEGQSIQEFEEFDVSFSTSVATNINNPGLEFFID